MLTDMTLASASVELQCPAHSVWEVLSSPDTFAVAFSSVHSIAVEHATAELAGTRWKVAMRGELGVMHGRLEFTKACSPDSLTYSLHEVNLDREFTWDIESGEHGCTVTLRCVHFEQSGSLIIALKNAVVSRFARHPAQVDVTKYVAELEAFLTPSGT